MTKEIAGKTNRPGEIGKKAIGIGLSAAVIGILALAGCRGVDAEKVEIRGTLAPSAAAGTPVPTETVEQAFERGQAAEQASQKKIADDKAAFDKAVAEEVAKRPVQTVTVPGPTIYVPFTPRPNETYRTSGYDIYAPRPESAIYGDFFGIRFNLNTRHYDLIDVRTNQPVDIGSHMVQPINNILTGVGNTSPISYYIYPGEAAVEQGYFVNREIGVFQIRMNRSNDTQWFNPTITDGAVTIVPIANAAAHEADALNRAIDNNWARQNARGEVK